MSSGEEEVAGEGFSLIIFITHLWRGLCVSVRCLGVMDGSCGLFSSIFMRFFVGFNNVTGSDDVLIFTN